jgi:hypothetical protein
MPPLTEVAAGEGGGVRQVDFADPILAKTLRDTSTAWGQVINLDVCLEAVLEHAGGTLSSNRKKTIRALVHNLRPEARGSFAHGKNLPAACKFCAEHADTILAHVVLQRNGIHPAVGGSGGERRARRDAAMEEDDPAPLSLGLLDFNEEAVQYILNLNFYGHEKTKIVGRLGDKVECCAGTDNDEPLFYKEALTDGRYCEHSGCSHGDDAHATITARCSWWGEQIPTNVSLSLRCSSEKCKDLKPLQEWPIRPGVSIYVKMKADFEKTCFKLEEPTGFGELVQGKVLMHTSITLKERFKNIQKVSMTMDPYDGAKVPFIGLWIEDPSIRTYERMDFVPPPIRASAKVFNTWQGFEAERILAGLAEQGSHEPFEAHLRMMCGESADYFITWLAHIVQKPGEKTDVVVQLMGAQGTGKGFVFENVMPKVLGDQYYVHTNDPHKIF